MKSFLVVDPLGSKGDQLIYLGMEKKLKELNIPYAVFRYKIRSFFHQLCGDMSKRLSQAGLQVIGENLLDVVYPVSDLMDKRIHTIKNTSATDIILLRGGAYLNDIWREYMILESIFRAARDNPQSIIIIAPQSFIFTTTEFPTFFKQIKQIVYVFCRERYSYDLLSSMNFPENVHIHLSHDTAFYLSKEDFTLQNEGGTYILVAPRRDRESAVTWKIKKTHPKKILFGDVYYATDFGSFVNIIGNACKVYTDRLHVAILSAILGKETYLYPNSYHKNKGVYELSLHGFPNVKFIGSHEFLDSA